MSRKTGRTKGSQPSHRATVEDAARRAGVSAVTVCRALNNSPLVNQATRERVLQAVREVGYRPNVQARALIKGKTEVLCFALQARHLMGEFYAEALAGFNSLVEPRRFRVQLSIAPESADFAAWLMESISPDFCDAAAIHCDLALLGGFATLPGLCVPVVVANYQGTPGWPRCTVPSVGFDQAGGTARAVRHLVSLGHKAIAYVGGPEGIQDSDLRRQGFASAMKECGLRLRDDWIAVGSFADAPHSGSEAFHSLFSAGAAKPTAVVCASDNLAGGVLLAARAWGAAVPRDLSVVGYDDFSWTSFSIPPLTTVSHKGWELGTAVASTLLSQHDAPSAKPQTIVLPTRLVVRESTAPPPHTP